MSDPTPAPEGAILTPGQRDKIAHAIGDASAKGCSTVAGLGSNVYCGYEDDEDWQALVAVELAKMTRRRWIAPSVYYSVTPKGRAALAHDLALIEAGS